MEVELTHALWEETPDAIIAIAPDGTVLYWNRAAETIFGYTSAQLLGEFTRAGKAVLRGEPAGGNGSAQVNVQLPLARDLGAA